MAQFVFNFVGGGDRLGDFRAQAFAIAPAQAMRGHFNRRLAHVQAGRQGRVSRAAAPFSEGRLELLKKRFLALAGVIPPQPGQRLFQQGRGPAPFEKNFRGKAVSRLEAEMRFLAGEVQRQRRLAAAAFLRARPVTLIGEEMFQGGQKEGAEASFALVHRVEVILFEQAEEKFLRQILGVVGALALAADVSVERTPIEAAQLFERFRRVAGILPARSRQDDTPVRLAKLSRAKAVALRT